MALRIVTADERMAETAGVKAVILGPAKVGKTTLLRTLDAPRTLVLNIEAGDLAVRDVPYQELRPEGEAQWTWQELRNVAAYLGGPQPNRPAHQPYSQAHYDHVAQELSGIDKTTFDTLFIDSITVASRICMAWSMQQPEAFSEKTGKPDTRGAYGLLGREMIGWITQLQHAKRKNVIFLGILDQQTDDFGRQTWVPQLDGQSTQKALPGIVDVVITLQAIPFAEGEPPVRCFVCKHGNQWGYPAGDRSGKLDLIEEPHLGKLIAKAADQTTARAAIVTDMARDDQAEQAAA